MIDIFKLHEKLDSVNADFGTKNCLCLFCEANTYDGKVGIIHNEGCIILQLRDEMKDVAKDSVDRFIKKNKKLIEMLK